MTRSFFMVARFAPGARQPMRDRVAFDQEKTQLRLRRPSQRGRVDFLIDRHFDLHERETRPASSPGHFLRSESGEAAGSRTAAAWHPPDVRHLYTPTRIFRRTFVVFAGVVDILE
jgi:hypothetical protein